MIERRSRIGPHVELWKRVSKKQADGSGENELEGTGVVITLDHVTGLAGGFWRSAFGSPTQAIASIAAGTMGAVWLDGKFGFDLSTTMGTFSSQIIQTLSAVSLAWFSGAIEIGKGIGGAAVKSAKDAVDEAQGGIFGVNEEGNSATPAEYATGESEGGWLNDAWDWYKRWEPDFPEAPT